MINKETDMRNTNTYKMILAAIFTAITSVLAGLSIPIPFTPVPLSLATFGVLLCGGILGFKYGSFSMLLYVLLGGFGVPVFSGYMGGIAKLLGPTGGYIIGYIACAFVIGIFIDSFEKMGFKANFPIGLFGGILGTLACYFLGTWWFMYVTKNTLTASLMLCVVPFLPGDSIKIIVSSFLISRLRPFLRKRLSNTANQYNSNFSKSNL